MSLIIRTDFLVTASCDGHVKFWKKTEEGIEFVKHYRGHLGEELPWCYCSKLIIFARVNLQRLLLYIYTDYSVLTLYSCIQCESSYGSSLMKDRID